MSRIQSFQDDSNDAELLRVLDQFMPSLESVSFDVPLALPPCIGCQLKCPGQENCKVASVQWMSEHHKKTNALKKNTKLFTPYTQRPVDLYLQSEFSKVDYAHDALGSNLAPLTTRAHFLSRRLKTKLYETITELSVLRIGENLGLPKKVLTTEGRAFDHDESRQLFLQSLLNMSLVFIYQQDMQRLIDHKEDFESFIAALTGFLKFMDQTELPPKGFPKKEAWVHYPIPEINWKLIL